MEPEPTDAASGVDDRVLDSDVLVIAPPVMLNRAVATDFPPRRTGIPVRDMAVVSVPAAAVVFDEEGFLADNLDGVVVDVVLLFWINWISFAAFSSFSKVLTFSSAAARKVAILSCFWTTSLFGFGPAEIGALSPDWFLEFVGLNAEEQGTEGGFNLDDEEFMAQIITMTMEDENCEPCKTCLPDRQNTRGMTLLHTALSVNTNMVVEEIRYTKQLQRAFKP
jgi:hypothetical protein